MTVEDITKEKNGEKKENKDSDDGIENVKRTADNVKEEKASSLLETYQLKNAVHWNIRKYVHNTQIVFLLFVQTFYNNVLEY